MKSFFNLKTIIAYTGLACIGVLGLSCCSDDSTAKNGGYDPSKPVEITDFTPKEGPSQTRLYITGKNFGTNPSQIFVKVGGVEAKVVGSNGTYIYCLVPRGATEGTVEVAVGQQENYTAADAKFSYIKKPKVETLCGYVDELGKSEAKDGTFEECGFANPRWLVVDPQDPTQIYMVDGIPGAQIRILDTKNRMTRTLFNKGQANMGEIRQISFTANGDTLLLANEQDDDQATAVVMLLRKNKFGQPKNIGTARKNNACYMHPTNGELYYNSRTNGDLFRYDWETNEAVSIKTGLKNDSQYFIFLHPSGIFAYVCVPSRKIILKWDYDEETQVLVPNNVPFCGQEGVGGHGKPNQDGNGANAMLGNPMQGVFILNEEAQAAGREDPYDFYFCDQQAHSIRILTPDATVATFAGRGSKGLNDNPYGYVDGDLLEEARFNEPQGMHYDEKNKVFYIAEVRNMRIRMIRMAE